jgi:hypothetical protein
MGRLHDMYFDRRDHRELPLSIDLEILMVIRLNMVNTINPWQEIPKNTLSQTETRSWMILNQP